MFRMSEGERIDRSSLLMRGGQAAPLKLSPEGAGHAPPPPAPPPMKGVNHPLQTTPAHTDAAPVGAAGYLSLTAHCTPAHPASRTARPLQFSTPFLARPGSENRFLRLPHGGRVPRSLTPLC